jgi:hypothetical protein
MGVDGTSASDEADTSVSQEAAEAGNNGSPAGEAIAAVAATAMQLHCQNRSSNAHGAAHNWHIRYRCGRERTAATCTNGARAVLAASGNLISQLDAFGVPAGKGLKRSAEVAANFVILCCEPLLLYTAGGLVQPRLLSLCREQKNFKQKSTPLDWVQPNDCF